MFDSCAAQYVRQFEAGAASRAAGPLPRAVHEELKGTFDIDILRGFDPSDVAFAKLMFHRRHVYEHNGGEADGKYIADSGGGRFPPT